MKKWRFAISSTGAIANRMAKLLIQMEEVTLQAVSSRTLTKALHFQQTYEVVSAYDSFEEMVQDPLIDIVYISSPHPFHFEQAKKALEGKKHVLCEKPLTLTAKQGEILQKTALTNQVICMEGMWTRFLPTIKKAQALVEEGAIGPVRLIEASFGGAGLQVERLSQKALAGGALLDIGVYPLHFAALFIKDQNPKIQSTATLTPEGVDGQNAITLTSSKGEIALLTSSIYHSLENQGKIYGDKGTITLPSFWGGEQVILQVEHQKEKIFSFPHPYGDGFYYEVKGLIQAIESQKADCSQMPMGESIRILHQMDQMRKDWGMVFPEEE